MTLAVIPVLSKQILHIRNLEICMGMIAAGLNHTTANYNYLNAMHPTHNKPYCVRLSLSHSSHSPFHSLPPPPPMDMRVCRFPFSLFCCSCHFYCFSFRFSFSFSVYSRNVAHRMSITMKDNVIITCISSTKYKAKRPNWQQVTKC